MVVNSECVDASGIGRQKLKSDCESLESQCSKLPGRQHLLSASQDILLDGFYFFLQLTEISRFHQIKEPIALLEEYAEQFFLDHASRQLCFHVEIHGDCGLTDVGREWSPGVGQKDMSSLVGPQVCDDV